MQRFKSISLINSAVVKGKFITIEGSDGAGKSTHIPFIKNLILEFGVEVLVTREPGGTVLGEALREILLNFSDSPISDEAELLLMFSARMQHLNEIILPALDQGKWVLCDRFTDATYAYQGGGRGINTNRIAILEKWVQKGLDPDLTLLLDVPVDVGLKRASIRNTEEDRFEVQKINFKEAVRESYLQRQRQFSGRIKWVNAEKSMEDVQSQIANELSEFYQRHFEV
jgi:dTMP kinase